MCKARAMNFVALLFEVRKKLRPVRMTVENTWPKKYIIFYVDHKFFKPSGQVQLPYFWYLSEGVICRSDRCQLEIMKLMSQPDQNRVLFVWYPVCSWSVRFAQLLICFTFLGRAKTCKYYQTDVMMSPSLQPWKWKIVTGKLTLVEFSVVSTKSIIVHFGGCLRQPSSIWIVSMYWLFASSVAQQARLQVSIVGHVRHGSCFLGAACQQSRCLLGHGILQLPSERLEIWCPSAGRRRLFGGVLQSTAAFCGTCWFFEQSLVLARSQRGRWNSDILRRPVWHSSLQSTKGTELRSFQSRKRTTWLAFLPRWGSGQSKHWN